MRRQRLYKRFKKLGIKLFGKDDFEDMMSYSFKKSLAKLCECSIEELQEYARRIEDIDTNLSKHKGKKGRPKKRLD